MSELERRSPLGRYTAARVDLARAGTAIGTGDQLQFQLDHARARDAVHSVADFAGLLAGLRERGLHALLLESAIPPGAAARHAYLRRPDLGRRLDAASAVALERNVRTPGPEIALVIADGLSALAIDRHALALVDALTGVLPADRWQQAPVCVVRNGRVAVGDEIGGLLQARMTILMIGERPGLSAPDSLGVYLTSSPRPGRTDAERNCISNIRPPEGLGYGEAARRVAFYVDAALAGGGTGFALKEEASPKLPGIG
jgi:ethanolamine ammonia-lyase small subunit